MNPTPPSGAPRCHSCDIRRQLPRPRSIQYARAHQWPFPFLSVQIGNKTIRCVAAQSRPDPGNNGHAASRVWRVPTERCPPPPPPTRAPLRFFLRTARSHWRRPITQGAEVLECEIKEEAAAAGRRRGTFALKEPRHPAPRAASAHGSTRIASPHDRLNSPHAKRSHHHPLPRR